MNEAICALAADTKVETPEGALTVKGLAGKVISVFTRESGGRVRFRRVLNVRKTADQQPVVKITLERGQSFRVGLTQVLFKEGMVECAAAQLAVGDRLQAGFYFPEGYVYRDDVGEAERVSQAGWRVTEIDAGGAADLYAFAVNRTGCFLLSAGIICKSEVASTD